jgi:hypothetical protein
VDDTVPTNNGARSEHHSDVVELGSHKPMRV